MANSAARSCAIFSFWGLAIFSRCVAQTVPVPVPRGNVQTLDVAVAAKEAAAKEAADKAAAADRLAVGGPEAAKSAAKAEEASKQAATEVDDANKIAKKPPVCWILPATPTCVKEKALTDNTSYDGAINNILGTSATFTPFNQIQSIYNSASGSATVSSDLGTLNFDSGIQVALVTNVQAGSAGSTSPSSGTLPTLSASGAGQAVQNLLYGGTFLGQVLYPVILGQRKGIPADSPDALILNVDVVTRGGADIQNFKASTNVNTSSPPLHFSTKLEGYLQYNSTKGANDPNGFNFTGAVFVGGSYGYDYMSHDYARNYGFGSRVSNGIGQASVGVLINGVVKVAFSRAFGPSQTYIDTTSMAQTTVNNFKSWSIGIAYQQAPSQSSK